MTAPRVTDAFFGASLSLYDTIVFEANQTRSLFGGAARRLFQHSIVTNPEELVTGV